MTPPTPNGLLKPRGGCDALPSTADLVVRVSPPIAGGEAASDLKQCRADYELEVKFGFRDLNRFGWMLCFSSIPVRIRPYENKVK